MSEFSFSELGYQVIRELGHNHVGGRVTYLARETQTAQLVIVKQFRFPGFGLQWAGYQTHEREIQVLQGLNHPGIPRYLNSFATSDAFFLVQEYKNAQSLAVLRSFAPDEIKQIALAILEILVYLQNRLPPIIHRDIKPENILVDEQMQVYLVDFGFAALGCREVGLSSAALGTLGFMPPEQLYNRQLTMATDLYGLGATLICLLTATKSTAIETLIDSDGRINFKSLLPEISLAWLEWLEKLVQPNYQNRYASAKAALDALKPIDVMRSPGVKFSSVSLEFQATHLGEILVQRFRVSNPTPETVLEGSWEVAAHPSDPPHTPEHHTWISLIPAQFVGNQIDCQVIVDTSKLMANQQYVRQVLLHTNSCPQVQPLTIKVQTVSLVKTKKPPYFYLAILIILSHFLAGLIPAFVTFSSYIAPATGIGALAGAAGGATIVANLSEQKRDLKRRVIRGCLFGALLGALITSVPMALVGLGTQVNWFYQPISLAVGITLGALAPVLEVNLIRVIGSRMAKAGYTRKSVLAILSLAVGLGISSGTYFWLGSWNQLVIAAVLGTGLPLTGMLLYPQLRRVRLLAKSRQAEPNLIKP